MGDQASSRAMKEFLAEAEEIIEKLNLDLMALGDLVETGRQDPDLLNGIFRGAHSLKGLSGMFGFDDITSLSHHMESLLDALRLGKLGISVALVEVLFDSVETLTRLVDGKGEGNETQVDVSPLMRRIDAILHGEPEVSGDPLSQSGIDPQLLKVLTEYEESRLLDNLNKSRNLLLVQVSLDLTSFDVELAEVSDLLKQQGEVISTLPCAGDTPDQIGFKLLVGSTARLEEVQALVGEFGGKVESATASSELKEAAGEVIFETPPPEPSGKGALPPVQVAEEPTESSGGSLRSISQSVRVDIDKLDLLMNIVGELVLSKSSIAAIASQLRMEGPVDLASQLQKAARALERKLDELQKGVMEVRMVPVAQLFDKMTRIVRRVSQEQGKKVQLQIGGAETELDKLIVEDLSDPLMHMIRNAIDHGIETPAERRASGKPEQGCIALTASQKGNHVVISVQDDGRGIDPEKVRRKAVQKGLIHDGVAISREEVFQLLLAPGFSTRDEVSDLSGRGVGMDVVKNNIHALSGMLEMDSRVGLGTAMTITLPITLAIIKALIVKVCNRTYAIPINSVMETLMVEPESVRTIERREVIDLRESTLPLLWLDEVFALPTSIKRDHRFFVAVVGLAEKRLGIVVDELLGQQDVVIKSLSSALATVKGVAGAAELGNQKTILVLDIGGLMNEAMRSEGVACAF